MRMGWSGVEEKQHFKLDVSSFNPKLLKERGREVD